MSPAAMTTVAPLARPGHPCPCCGQMVPRRSGFVSPDAWRTHALDVVSADLGHHRGDGWRFLEAVFCECDRGARCERLADLLAVHPSTLASRFERVGLPRPGRYLKLARLVAACSLLDDPHRTIADVAYALRHNSPQGMARSTRIALGIAPHEMRARYSGEAMLWRYRRELVRPYATILRTAALLTDDVRAAHRRRRREAA